MLFFLNNGGDKQHSNWTERSGKCSAGNAGIKVEDIVSRIQSISIKNQTKTFVALLLVFAVFLANASTVFADSPQERGGIWSHVLSPYLYYPSGEVALPELSVGEQVIDMQVDRTAQALFQFASSILNGKEDVVTGVFVNDVLAYPVIQQPSGSAAYVSTQDDVVTQFSLASQYGTVGILAHNYLAGLSFFELSSGQDVYVVYGNGETAHYVITEVRRFQALQPYSPYSEFIDLDTNAQYNSTNVFNEVYGESSRLVLQTCIAAEGVDSWGRLFVIAELVS